MEEAMFHRQPEWRSRVNGAGQVDDTGQEAESSSADLVKRAQEGDTEAFGELIEQHRRKALNWAERMTGDPHMADDIVQDALIRAFLHLGTLTDTSRFRPWLYRIVRNQANMRLRRGGPYRKEKPFTAWRTHTNQLDAGRVDWENLDNILAHLKVSSSEAASLETDPEVQLLRKELYETIHALLHCLNRKERAIFEAHFFRQLAPDEIAALYRMSTGSVYTYLYRSRQKLRKAHICDSLGLIPESKKGAGLLMGKRKVLPLADWPPEGAVQMTFMDRIGHLLATLGDRPGNSELMGLSGFAFRMKISNKTTFADGIYVFDWRKTAPEVLKALGCKVTLLCGQLAESPVPLLAAVERFPVVLPIEESVLPFIRKYIELGKPLLYFDTLAARPYVHEWSLIYGYDDERRVVHLTDRMHSDGKTLTYEDVTENPVRFLVGIDEKAEPHYAATRESAVKALRFACRYARHGDDYRPMTSYLSYSSGLAAYERWTRHLRSDAVSPNRYGMGQLSAVNADAKRHASRYLRSLELDGEAMRLALLASEAYEKAAEELEAISVRVPFIRTAELLPLDLREWCAVQLERAQGFEAAAVGYLEKVLENLEKEHKE